MVKDILILDKVREKVQFWVNNCDTEVSGFGTAVYDEEHKMIVVTDAWVLKQETFGAAHTEIKAEALQELMEKTEGDLRWWWHSHVNMQAFWSTTDLDTIKELGAAGWIAATVFNKRAEVRSAICAKAQSDFGATVYLNDNAQTLFEAHERPEEKEWKAELDQALAAAKKPVVPIAGRQSSFFGDPGWEDPHHKKDMAAPLSANELQWMLDTDPGYLGFGLREEARVLGIPAIDYFFLLEVKPDARTNEQKSKLAVYEGRLEKAAKKGKLKYKESYGNSSTDTPSGHYPA